jgi:hypothetical protein
MPEVDELMTLFATIPSAIICRGPEHPKKPEQSVSERLRQWLSAHPFLDQDEGYVQFLKRYAGAVVADKNGRFRAFVSGFHPQVGYLEDCGFVHRDPTEPALDGRGLYQFALMQYDRSVAGKFLDRHVFVCFSFDGTGTRPWGIYRDAIVGQQPRGTEELICGSFCEWLRKVYAGTAHPILE